MYRLNETKRGDYLLIGRYDGDLIDKIRATPPGWREWDPVVKAWRIDARRADDVRRIVEDHYLVGDDIGAQMMARIRVLEETVNSHADLLSRLCQELGVDPKPEDPSR